MHQWEGHWMKWIDLRQYIVLTINRCQNNVSSCKLTSQCLTMLWIYYLKISKFCQKQIIQILKNKKKALGKWSWLQIIMDGSDYTYKICTNYRTTHWKLFFYSFVFLFWEVVALSHHGSNWMSTLFFLTYIL